MPDRVRIQLQQGQTHIDSVQAGSISAEDAIKALDGLCKKNKDYINDAVWEKEFSQAIAAAKDWVKRVKQGGGLEPKADRQTQKDFKFKCKGKEYRIDIETFGNKSADWFR